MSGADKTPMDPEARRTRQRQVLLFSGVAAAVLIVFAVWISAGGGGGWPPPTGIEAKLAGPDTAEVSWVRRSEARIGELETRLRDMETRGRRAEQENVKLRERLARGAEDGRAVIDQQEAAIEELRGRLEARAAAPGPAGTDDFTRAGSSHPAPGKRAPATSDAAPAVPMIQVFEGDADPAGKGVASQGEPRPVLLRLTGPARSAAEGGEALEADVAGSTLTGAGPSRGTVTETQVAGFVAGSGKVGIRGPVVSREGALVEKAFLAGLISGVGETAANLLQAPARTTGSDGAVNASSLAALGQAGIGAGAGSAGRRVADYLIRRAEQYQPVIQLQTGTRVTVVFIEGAWLDGRKDKKRGGK